MRLNTLTADLNMNSLVNGLLSATITLATHRVPCLIYLFKLVGDSLLCEMLIIYTCIKTVLRLAQYSAMVSTCVREYARLYEAGMWCSREYIFAVLYSSLNLF